MDSILRNLLIILIILQILVMLQLLYRNYRCHQEDKKFWKRMAEQDKELIRNLKLIEEVTNNEQEDESL